ncbi:MAG: rod shape-determining protein RodA, partial [Acidimicrobiia bacterium]|nr:rod shape-determining protein RodA [Acidimicrobiia bacterium]
MATVASSASSAVEDRRANSSDWILLGTSMVLALFGLLMIYSATRAMGTISMERQMMFAAIGAVSALVMSLIDYRDLRHRLPVLCGLVLLALIAVFFFPEINGARRWIPLGPFAFQPAEFAKIIAILGMAAILAPERPNFDTSQLRWSRIFMVLGFIAIPSVLIFMEPDLGTMLVFVFVGFVMFFAAGASWRQMAVLGFGGMTAVVLAFWTGLLADYQLDRFRVLIDQDLDPQGIGYNLLRSKLAIGSGQLTGRGLFQGDATNFRYIPEQETDFIFTAVGEQLGFVGGLLVLLAFGMIIWRLLVIAANARDRFGTLIAVGISAMLMFQVFVNIGMTVGIMPVTGIPLPFMSLGGSSFQMTTIA